MSPARDVLRRLRASGADIDVAEDRLRVTAPADILTQDVRIELAGLRLQLLQLFADAVQLLNHRGVRLIRQGERMLVAVWGDADDAQVRAALEDVGLGDAGVLHLDDPDADIPDRYREFVPGYVREIWDRQGLLTSPSLRLKAEAKARYLNRLFDSLGTAPRRSRITGATVLHGMLRNKAASD